jgi:hypothetical protein
MSYANFCIVNYITHLFLIDMPRMIKKSTAPNAQSLLTLGVVALVAVIAGGVIMIANNTYTPKPSNKAAELTGGTVSSDGKYAPANVPCVDPGPDQVTFYDGAYFQPGCYGVDGIGNYPSVVYNTDSIKVGNNVQATLYTGANYTGNSITITAGVLYMGAYPFNHVGTNAVRSFTIQAKQPNNTQFTDVPSGSTFYPYVRCLVTRGVVSGYGSEFRVNNNVTRGQLTKMVVLSAGYTDAIPADRQSFVDVLPGSTFWLYVEQAKAHNAIDGYACGGPGEPCTGTYFRPNNNMTRGQASKVIANSYPVDYNIPAGQQSFVDVLTTNTFYSYIEKVNARGIVNGYQCGSAGEPCPGMYFRPNNNITRGQATKMIANTWYYACHTLPDP